MRKRIIAVSVRFLAGLSLRRAQRVGELIGRLGYRVLYSERRTADVNIALCFPELALQQRRARVRASLRESAKTLAEIPGIWSRPIGYAVGLVRSEAGRDVLERALARGRGLVVAAPHIGNWEIVGLYAQSMFPMTILYRAPKEQVLEPLMRGGRTSGGGQLVSTDAAGIKAVYGALRRGEAVGILPDQQPRTVSGGVFAPLFGQTALTMTLLGRLARKSRATVVFCVAERLPDGEGFRIHWLPAPEGIDDPDPEVAATALNRGVEACVAICPDQYQWSYKRFRLQPNGAASPYRKGRSG
jgi:KDO2-lipid IV(A) lauroyltransferase